ncbi:MAG TPA: hypothetical protein VGM50_04740 [Gemmatimonadaceae bacterium]
MRQTGAGAWRAAAGERRAKLIAIAMETGHRAKLMVLAMEGCEAKREINAN